MLMRLLIQHDDTVLRFVERTEFQSLTRPVVSPVPYSLREINTYVWYTRTKDSHIPSHVVR